MTISPRRRRRQTRRIYIITAGILLLCGIIAWALWGRSRKARPASAALEPPAATASAPMDSPSPSPTPSASPSSAQMPIPTAVAPKTPAPAPRPTQALQRSALERSLYQGSLSIVDSLGEGRLSLTYVNKGTETLYALYFHLYPNTQISASLSIARVSLNGVSAYYTLEAEGALLYVPLVNELREGESARVFIEFTVHLPKYGFGPAPAAGEPIPLLCVFPTAAVYENGWVTESTPERVDYAPLADWRLGIEATRTPAFTGGETQDLGGNRYLCTGRSALAALTLGS